MAKLSIDQLQVTSDQFWINTLHASIASYLYNLLHWLGTDINNFKERADAQVRSLTERRTAVQEEKLVLPDYQQALAHIKQLMKDKGWNFSE